VLTASPDGYLCDGDADHQQQDGRLDVGPPGDGKGLVRPGKEEIEPNRHRHGGEDSGQPVPVRGHRHHYQQQDQRRVGVRDAGPERHQDRRHRHGDDDGGKQRHSVPAQPTNHPGHLLVKDVPTSLPGSPDYEDRPAFPGRQALPV
jgi:hypothetical protein